MKSKRVTGGILSTKALNKFTGRVDNKHTAGNAVSKWLATQDRILRIIEAKDPYANVKKAYPKDRTAYTDAENAYPAYRTLKEEECLAEWKKVVGMKRLVGNRVQPMRATKLRKRGQ